jgi:hypothetical protein
MINAVCLDLGPGLWTLSVLPDSLGDVLVQYFSHNIPFIVDAVAAKY